MADPLWVRIEHAAKVLALRAAWGVIGEAERRRAKRGDYSRPGFDLPAREGSQPASKLLFDRLTPQVISDVEKRVAQEPGLALFGGEASRRHQILAYGLYLAVPGVAEATGLSLHDPPPNVHAMARGPLAAAGGLYEADLLVDALNRSGVPIDQMGRALDFGCSSGRVLRVLSAAYPQVRLSGCDPNSEAVGYVRRELNGVEAFVSGDEPPLELDSSCLDLVYAISIWSHFAPALGLRWLEEMARVLRPGGILVLTAHGFQSVAHYFNAGLRPPEQCGEILEALYRTGWWYLYEFGDEGDWGVKNPGWGSAFLSPEWLLAKTSPNWRLLDFQPGRNLGDQDVYVLQRV